ncbi:PREDICTED: uncharacterized protein LOC108566919 [Nicrophorus vespilloides]|uniref:Regulatory protein zeste n=1 Tax=Nicrophorus vespilloides TaxID=110193 RepID=A0ABM1N6U2_NICVS|nr:PREDICTED: uncharacterized protein LOC108566919 [Nicrophorus vespilloides]
MDIDRPKRDRSANFSNEDTQLLVNIIYNYANVIENKTTNAIIWHKKEDAWKRVTTEFNSRRPMKRTMKMLKIKYEGLKRALKKKSTMSQLEPLKNVKEKILAMKKIGYESMLQDRDNNKAQVAQTPEILKYKVTDEEKVFIDPFNKKSNIQAGNKIIKSKFNASENEFRINDSSLESWDMQTAANDNTTYKVETETDEGNADDSMDYIWDLRATTSANAKNVKQQNNVAVRLKCDSALSIPHSKELSDIELQIAIQDLRNNERNHYINEQDVLNKAQSLTNNKNRLSTSNFDFENEMNVQAIEILAKQRQLEFSILDNARREKEHSLTMIAKEKELEFAILENGRKEKEHAIRMRILQYKLQSIQQQ